MTTIFILFLFITQIVSFYFLALLYTKVSKFDDLEKKQRRLMSEMDDSIGAYLSELKDENDRLIAELSAKDEKKVVKPIAEPKKEKAQVFKVPVNLALKSYEATNSRENKTKPELAEVVDDRTKVIRLHEAGQSIEEIAKSLDKGKTEIELILKFR